MAHLHEATNGKRPAVSDRLQAARRTESGGGDQESSAAIAAHAKELMLELIRRGGLNYTPEHVAQTAFAMARAFAAEAIKENGAKNNG